MLMLTFWTNFCLKWDIELVIRAEFFQNFKEIRSFIPDSNFFAFRRNFLENGGCFLIQIISPKQLLLK
jgi:hypothetical protein